MSAKLYALGRWCFEHGKRVVLIWLLIAAVIGGLAAVGHGRFDDNFKIPGSSSEEALERLHMTFPEGAAINATAVIIAPKGHTVDEFKDRIEQALPALEKVSIVDKVMSPWFEHVTGQVSDDGRAALARVTLSLSEMPTPEQLEPLTKAGETLQSELPEGTRVIMGGQAYDIQLPEMSLTEVVGVVLAYVVMAVMLGSLVAATIPIFTALVGVGITMAIMFLGTGITEINSTTPILAVMLGLAVGIDYALFIYARHRDQLAAQMATDESIARAIGTAGTAVVFAGITNAIALTGLAIVGIPFLTVMGIFASLAVILAVLIALTLLPAFAGLLGERMRPKKVRKRMAAAADADAHASADSSTDVSDQRPVDVSDAGSTASKASQGKPAKKGLFPWWVGVTTSHPIATIVAVVLTLGILTVPAINLHLSLPNASEQPPESSARQAYDLIQEHFGPGYNNPLVVTAGIIGSTDPLGLIKHMRQDIEGLEGIERVVMAVPNQNADTALIQVIPKGQSSDPSTLDTVERLRELVSTWGSKYDVKAAVTGFTAVQIDVTQRLGQAIWPFGILVVGLSLVLLAAIFRSVWVPVKTAVGFVLSVGASFGITQLVFNEGWFKAIINLEKPVAIISFLPILMMAILFGLAMDYEVFIVSRIREEYVHGKSAIQAIRDGFVASGPVVTAAALIMFVVFAFFVPAGMMAIKAIAFALAIGVVIDAFLIRMTLVPAVLALLKDRAWWMPGWLDKALPKFDMEGEVLTHQLAMADWPGDGSVVHADQVGVEQIVAPFSLVVQPGQVAGITGSLGARSGAALALSGRLAVDEGRARVSGSLLPEAAGTVRRRTAYVDLSRAVDIAAAVSDIEPADGMVVFLDGLDAVGSPSAQEAVDNLVSLARGSTFSVVCTASNEQSLRRVSPDVSIQVSEPVVEVSAA